MEIDKTKAKVVIAKQACVSVDAVVGTVKLTNLDLDSLDMVEAVMAIEDELNVEIIDFDMDPDITVDQFLELIEKNCAAVA